MGYGLNILDDGTVWSGIPQGWVEEDFVGTNGTRLDAHTVNNNSAFNGWTSATGTISSNAAIHTEELGAEKVTGGVFTKVAGAAVTLANMRISAVAGTAFVDFSTADLLTDHIGKILTVKDSAGKVISGYIKAAGTGETLGSEIFANPGFDADTNWVKEAGWTIAGGVGVATNSDGNKGVVQLFTLGSGKLYKESADVVVTSGTAELYIRIIEAGPFIIVNSISSSGSYSLYSVTNGVEYWHGFKAETVFTGTVDNVSGKQVLTPSATGVTIVSTPGGATYNWMYQEVGFNYNDSSNYTYEIYAADFIYGTGWYPSSNTAVKIAGTASDLEQNTSNVAGVIYKDVFTLTRTAGTLTPEVGGATDKSQRPDKQEQA